MDNAAFFVWLVVFSDSLVISSETSTSIILIVLSKKYLDCFILFTNIEFVIGPYSVRNYDVIIGIV